MNDELRQQWDDEHAPPREGHPVTRPARWALSPLDSSVHLLSGAGQLPGELDARCGARLPAAAIQRDQPPPGPPCEDCRQIFLADAEAPR